MYPIPRYDFYKTKYGEELLIDLVSLETIRKYVAVHPVHRLSYFDITFITEGSGFFVIDDQHYRVQPGDVVFSRPNEIRTWDHEHIGKGYALIFEEEFLLSFFNDPFFLQHLSYYHPKRPTAKLSILPIRPRIDHLQAEILSELKNYQAKDKHILRALLYEILMLLNREYAASTPFSDPATCAGGRRHLHAFFDLVSTHCTVYRQTNYYADRLCITPNYLNEIVQKYTGFTAKSYILDRVLLEAKKLLSYTPLSIAEIACRLNFDDSSYFIRLFRNQTHCTPLQYRARTKR